MPHDQLQAKCVFGIDTDALTPFSNTLSQVETTLAIPGVGNPAVSTGDYYWINPYWMRPYDLTTMGTPGANVIAANGGYRYVWVFTEDHPAVNQDFRDQYGFWFAFSNDPGVLPDPSTMHCGIPTRAVWAGGLYGGQTLAAIGAAGAIADMAAWLVYNPDDASFPFYLYSQGHVTGFPIGSVNMCALHRSADMIVWTPYGASHCPDFSVGGGYTAFQRVDRINSTTWTSRGLGVRIQLDFISVQTFFWRSSDGKSFSPSAAPSLDVCCNCLIPPDSSTSALFSTGTGTLLPNGRLNSNVSLWSGGDVGKQILVEIGGFLTASIINNVNSATSIDIKVGYDLWNNVNPTYGVFAAEVTNQPIQVEWCHLMGQVLGTPGTGTTLGTLGNQSQYVPSATEDVVISGQLYGVFSEYANWKQPSCFATTNPSQSQPRYITLAALDADFNCLASPSPIRIATSATTYNNCIPSPQFLQDVNGYQEDGVLHIYAAHGYSSQVSQKLAGTPYSSGGGLLHKWIDYYTYIYDTSAAASSAPCGVVASSSRGTVTMTWYNAVPSTTYVINRYTSLANLNSNTSPVFVGSVTSNASTAVPCSIFDTPGAVAQYWYKVANNNGGKFRFVHAYVDMPSASAGISSSLVSRHINRVKDDNGGSIPASLDITHLTRVDSWLTAQGLQSNLLYWADPRFGVKISAGAVKKVYCLGTTKLPRGLDLSADASNPTDITYSATALNSTLPGWQSTNAANYMEWGVNLNDPNQKGRYNHIRRKKQITVAALYQRTDTSVNATLLGSSTSTSSGYDPNGAPLYDGQSAGGDALLTGMYLQHGSGTPGTITFALRDQTSLKTCTVTASANANTVAVGTYDGISMFAYSDGTPGTAVTTLDPNPIFANDTFLAGARDQGGVSGRWPFLCSGSQGSYYNANSGNSLTDGSSPYFPGIQDSFSTSNGSAPARYFSTSYAKFNAGSLVVFDVALTSAQIKSLTQLLNGLTVDIKADYGAVADGQLATATLSITSGLKVLTSTTAIFNATPNAEVGKYAAVTGAGASGAALFGGLITASTSTTLTLTNAAATSLTASVQQVEWGHDDTPAFLAFRAAWQGQTGVTLTIPGSGSSATGRYCCVTGSGGTISMGLGIAGLTVNGTSDPVLSDMFGTADGIYLGGSSGGQIQDNTHDALVQTVTPGTTIIPLVNTSDVSLFTPFSWAVMVGFDVQGPPQYPNNPQFFEFVYIIATHTGAGGGDPSTVTIQSPLKYTYKSTWPNWSVGSAFEVPSALAQLFVLQAGWDCAHTYNDLVVEAHGSVFNCGGRSITLNGGSAPFFGPNISAKKDFTLSNYSVGTGWEIDKIVETATLTNVTHHHGSYFNPAPYLTTISNSTISELGGCGTNLVVQNSTIGDAHFGSLFGSNFTVNVANTSFSGVFSFGGNYEDNITTTGAYTMSGGVISRVKGAGTGAPPLWAVPGQHCFFGSRYNAEELFKIIDVTDDGTSIHITTDQTGGFPNLVAPGTALRIFTHPAPSLTFTGCTGNDTAAAWSLAPAGNPIFTYWKKTYTSAVTATGYSAGAIPMVGTLVSIKFTVAAGYSAGTFDLSGPFIIEKPGNVQVIWNPVIDLTIAGTRTLTPANFSYSGMGGADNIALPQANIWLVDNQMTPHMSGAVGSGSITVEFITDQGFNLAPAPAVLASIPFRTSG